MSKKKMVMSISPVDNYRDLPYYEEVEKFIEYLAKNADGETFDHLENCFFIASELKFAYLAIALCFGGLDTTDYLPKDKIPEVHMKRLKKQLETFQWNEKLPVLTLFRRNSRKYGSLYPFLYHEIFPNLSESECLNVFNIKKQSFLLNGVKIRKWEFDNYNEIKRKNQSAELARVNGTRYLLIVRNSAGKYNVGMICDDFQFESRASMASSGNEEFKKIEEQERERLSKEREQKERKQAEDKERERRQRNEKDRLEAQRQQKERNELMNRQKERQQIERKKARRIEIENKERGKNELQKPLLNQNPISPQPRNNSNGTKLNPPSGFIVPTNTTQQSYKNQNTPIPNQVSLAPNNINFQIDDQQSSSSNPPNPQPKKSIGKPDPSTLPQYRPPKKQEKTVKLRQNSVTLLNKQVEPQPDRTCKWCQLI